MDISSRATSRAFFTNVFEMIEETPKFDFWMNVLKRVKIICMDDKVMHYSWLVGNISKESENSSRINRATI